jgi:hypothetical protein
MILPQFWGTIPPAFTNYYDYYSSIVGQTQAYNNDIDSLSTNWDLYNKWTSAESFFNWTDNFASTLYNGIFYSNHLNGSGGFPYFFASGQVSPFGLLLATGATQLGSIGSGQYPDFPRVNCLGTLCTIAFEGMNQLTAEYLNGIPFADGNEFQKRPNSTVGIVQADFPGADLIEAIANVNPGINLSALTVPFSAFRAQLTIYPNQPGFSIISNFTLGNTSNGINPGTEAVTLQMGAFVTTITPGSLAMSAPGTYSFVGAINGVNLKAQIKLTGGNTWEVGVIAQNVNLTDTPAMVTLNIGDDGGTTPVTAVIP